MRWFTALALALMLSSCCASENPWHTAPWRYGYEPAAPAPPPVEEYRPAPPTEQAI